MKLKEKVNIKQDIETFILIKVSGTKSTTSKNLTAFIGLFRITSSEEGAIGGGYRILLLLLFYKFFYYFKSHIAGRWLSFYSDL